MTSPHSEGQDEIHFDIKLSSGVPSSLAYSGHPFHKLYVKPHVHFDLVMKRSHAWKGNELLTSEISTLLNGQSDNSVGSHPCHRESARGR